MRITRDPHIRTRISGCAKSGTATVSNFVSNARGNGLTKIGFSIHMWDSAVPYPIARHHTQTFPHVETPRAELEKADALDMSLSFGCECEYEYATRPGHRAQR